MLQERLFFSNIFSLRAKMGENTILIVLFNDLPIFLVEIVARVDSPVQGGENSARRQNTALRQTKLV